MLIKIAVLSAVAGLFALSNQSMAQSSKLDLDDKTYCASLKEIVDHTRNDFSDIRTNNTGPDEWAVRIVLHTQERCTILDDLGEQDA